jgi:hypothetical protein
MRDFEPASVEAAANRVKEADAADANKLEELMLKAAACFQAVAAVNGDAESMSKSELVAAHRGDFKVDLATTAAHVCMTVD